MRDKASEKKQEKKPGENLLFFVDVNIFILEKIKGNFWIKQLKWQFVYVTSNIVFVLLAKRNMSDLTLKVEKTKDINLKEESFGKLFPN